MIIPLYLHTYTRTCISGCAVFAVVIFIAVAGVVVTVISVTYFVFLFFFTNQIGRGKS